MPFCPSCRYEYEPHATVCPDCEVQLVDTLPEQNQERIPDDVDIEREWAKIARFHSMYFADLAVQALRAKEIPAVIQSHAGYFGMVMNMGLVPLRPDSVAVFLWVPHEYVDQAAKEAEVVLGEEWEKAKLIQS